MFALLFVAPLAPPKISWGGRGLPKRNHFAEQWCLELGTLVHHFSITDLLENKASFRPSFSYVLLEKENSTLNWIQGQIIQRLVFCIIYQDLQQQEGFGATKKHLRDFFPLHFSSNPWPPRATTRLFLGRFTYESAPKAFFFGCHTDIFCQSLIILFHWKDLVLSHTCVFPNK